MLIAAYHDWDIVIYNNYKIHFHILLEQKTGNTTIVYRFHTVKQPVCFCLRPNKLASKKAGLK